MNLHSLIPEKNTHHPSILPHTSKPDAVCLGLQCSCIPLDSTSSSECDIIAVECIEKAPEF